MPDRPAVRRRGFLFVVLAAVCWGTAGVSGSVVLGRTDLGPLDVAWHRMAVAALALSAGHLLTRRRRADAPPVRPARDTVVRLVVVGAALAAYQLAFFAAVPRAGVSIATLVALGLAPLLVAVGATLLGHGRPDVATMGSLAVAVVGLVLLVGISAGEAGPAVVVGAVLAGGSALAYAVVTLVGAGVPSGVPVTLVGFVVGALLLTPAALASGLRTSTDPVALALLVYMGVVGSALAYAFFFAGIRTVPGPVASIVTLLEPLTATALATAFLGERLAPAALAGGLLLLTAVAGLYLRGTGDGRDSRTARTARRAAPGARSPSASATAREDS